MLLSSLCLRSDSSLLGAGEWCFSSKMEQVSFLRRGNNLSAWFVYLNPMKDSIQILVCACPWEAAHNPVLCGTTGLVLLCSSLDSLSTTCFSEYCFSSWPVAMPEAFIAVSLIFSHSVWVMKKDYILAVNHLNSPRFRARIDLPLLINFLQFLQNDMYKMKWWCEIPFL